MTGEWSIREGQGHDVPDILQLWRDADTTVSVTDTADDIRCVLANPAALLNVALIDGRIVGTVIGTFDGWRGNIYRMAVHRDYRRQGIASGLLDSVGDFFNSVGAKRITALVESEHPWVVGFWESLGYQYHQGMERYYLNRSNTGV